VLLPHHFGKPLRPVSASYDLIRHGAKNARVTTADADQATVAAFRPWRVSQARIPWALTRTILPPQELRRK